MHAKSPSVAISHSPRPRGRPRAEDVQGLEDRLISVARQIFMEKGYGTASMTSIALAARVSKNTLYARFPSKADLFRAIIDHQIERTEAAVQRHAPRSGGSLEAALMAYGEQTLRASLEPETLQINRLIYGESGRFPELAQVANGRHKTGVARVARLLRDGAATDGMADRDVDSIAEFFIIMLRGWYSQLLVTDEAVSGTRIRNTVDRMVRIFMLSRGIG